MKYTRHLLNVQLVYIGYLISYNYFKRFDKTLTLNKLAGVKS